MQSKGQAPKTVIKVAGIKIIEVVSDERGEHKQVKLCGVLPIKNLK